MPAFLQVTHHGQAHLSLERFHIAYEDATEGAFDNAPRSRADAAFVTTGCVILTDPIDGDSVIRILNRSEESMTAVTVSPKFQVVIPKEIRDALGIVSGQKIQMLTYQGRIELIPLKPMREMRGSLKGIDSRVERDKDRP